MKIADRILGWLLLALGLLHTAASVILMSRGLTLESAWFFAGGLAIIFGAFLNLIRGYRPDKAIARTSLLANVLLVVLSVILVWALRHDLKQNPQAVVFVVLAALEFFFSLRP